MSDNPARPINKALFYLIALSLVVLDFQHTGLITRAFGALFGASGHG